jgi:hypothetical protein
MDRTDTEKGIRITVKWKETFGMVFNHILGDFEKRKRSWQESEKEGL